MGASQVFDDMGGRFEARLRDYRVVSRTSRMREGDVTLTDSIAVLEVKFDFEVLDRLHMPTFVGIERPTSKGATYLIYEVAGLRPIHFQMLGMDMDMPTVIRKEYLNIIDSSWGKSDETWIDVTCVPTQYRMDLDGGGGGRGEELEFRRSKLVPLIGSRAHLLSNEAVRDFLCVDGGISVGTLMGFDMPLRASIDSMVKYHMGIFGFTGSGKSNLTSYLIREALKKVEGLKVVVFDVAGEYAINLLDVLSSDGAIYSTEDFKGKPERFLDSQAIPETLEDALSLDILTEKVQGLFKGERIRRLLLEKSEKASTITLGFIISILERVSESREAGSPQVAIALQDIEGKLLAGKGYDRDVEVSAMEGEDADVLKGILGELAGSVHSMSSLKRDMDALIGYIERGRGEERVGGEGPEAAHVPMNPERLASAVLGEDKTRLNVIYVPEPDRARYAVSRFIDRLLFLKKTAGARRKVLVVLDEAQEFIPDRVVKGDFSEESNRAVEALLRQGRKYRAHCWLSTQRVAHLNVNALQQLHSYFVSTLPRSYDRTVIADAFSLSYDMLERTTELETGQWLFVSYKATKQKNVPAFIQAPNNEEVLLRSLGLKRE